MQTTVDPCVDLQKPHGELAVAYSDDHHVSASPELSKLADRPCSHRFILWCRYHIEPLA